MAENNVDISFKILKHIGTIATIPTGWCKEVNIVSWNGSIPKFDIREWDPTHERMTRGITLHTEEATALAQILSDYFAKTAASVSITPVTTPDNA